jgi:hypothetical protein
VTEQHVDPTYALLAKEDIATMVLGTYPLSCVTLVGLPLPITHGSLNCPTLEGLVRGARGVEVIPNLSFWKDFPFLLKDGFLFTFTCPCVRNRGGSLFGVKA